MQEYSTENSFSNLHPELQLIIKRLQSGEESFMQLKQDAAFRRRRGMLFWCYLSTNSAVGYT